MKTRCCIACRIMLKLFLRRNDSNAVWFLREAERQDLSNRWLEQSNICVIDERHGGIYNISVATRKNF